LLIAWTVMVFAVWIAVSFTSYVPDDAPMPGGRFANMGGTPGRMVAHLFVEPFGVGAFRLPFFMLFAASRVRTQSKVTGPHVKLFGVLLFMLTLGILCEVALPNRALPHAETPVGGILGSWIASKVVPHLGRLWSLVFVGISTGGALILA